MTGLITSQVLDHEEHPRAFCSFRHSSISRFNHESIGVLVFLLLISSHEPPVPFQNVLETDTLMGGKSAQ
ncbi:MAG: hypothetical protein CVU64_01960 [Deltaproteobacteria bacterium HGW-Deltaproteobacteria-21]|jgi:hypothetical protein|nr:MAG: hypothetical protein CVU64_01960 [Deltaproteobacteria bacterium HGW-Deltaproteobacteria-21]